MKRILIVLLLLAVVPVWATVLYEENFESYETGTQMVDQEGWDFYSTYDGNTTVVDNAPSFTSKVLELSQSESGSAEYVMVFTPAVNIAPEVPGREVTMVSASVICSSATDSFSIYDANGNRFLYLHMDAYSGTMTSETSDIAFDNINMDGQTPNDISFVYDSLANKIVAISCNGSNVVCDIPGAGFSGQPCRLRLAVQITSLIEGATGSYYDNLKIETVPRSEDPTLYCADDALIPLDSTSAEFALYNGGVSGTINYSVTTDASWLEVEPSSGSFESDTVLTLKASESVPDGFYRGNMTVDAGAAGSKVVSVMCSKGNVIFEEKFDDMEDGNIVGQRGWTVDNGLAVITNAYGCDGKCFFAYGTGGYDAASMYLPKPWYENLIVKVSFDMYWPSTSTCTGVCFLQKDSGTNEKFENAVLPDYDNNCYKLDNIQKSTGSKTVKNFPTAPMDEWVSIEYTMDLKANKLLSYGWAGAITNFSNWKLKNEACNFFNSWGCSHYVNTFEGVNIAVDNLKIERVEREKGPEMIVNGNITIGHGESGEFSLRNGGKGSYDFTAEVIDLPDNLTLSAASGTVEADAVNITATVNREGLEENYYRTRVRFDAGEAGCATSVVAFAVGNVYYFADFEEPFFVCDDLGGQDGWLDDGPGVNTAYVMVTNNQQVAMIETGGGYGGYMHTCDVPENQLVKIECDLFLPPAIFERESLLGREVIYFKQNSQYSSSADITLNIDFMDGVPIVYGYNAGQDYAMATTEYTYEWMHVSYVIDYLEGWLAEFSIDDNVDYPGDIVATSDPGAGCTLFTYCVTSRGNIQFDNIKVSVVPEPAVLGFLALIALALIRRK